MWLPGQEVGGYRTEVFPRVETYPVDRGGIGTLLSGPLINVAEIGDDRTGTTLQPLASHRVNFDQITDLEGLHDRG